jgi:hypothetical protein
MKIMRATIIVSAILIAAALPMAVGAQDSTSFKADNDRLCANWLAHSQWSGQFDAAGQRVCACVSGYTPAAGPVCLKIQSNIAIVNGHRVQTFADGSRLDLDTNEVISNGNYKPSQPTNNAVPTPKNTVRLVWAGLGIGEPCSHPEHSVCIPPGSRMNAWQCDDNYFEYDGQCYPKAIVRVPRTLSGRSGDDKFWGCLQNHGAGSVWDLWDKKCVCREAFSAAPDGVHCEPVDRGCFKRIGTDSYYNFNLNSCVCQAGHDFVGGICQ